MHSIAVARELHLSHPPSASDRPTSEPDLPDLSRNDAPRADLSPAAGNPQTAGEPFWLRQARLLPHLCVSYDADERILWQFMAPKERPSFTPELIASMTTLLNLVEMARRERSSEREPIRHMVLGSRTPGIFNLGGDLFLFMDLIARGDRDRLRQYAHSCVAGQHRLWSTLGRSVSTIALVQGDALGGGFEAVLAHRVIVAERRARFGLPEVLFNLFPGMGAYSFLSRRLSAAQAERMIVSGRVYSAEEMHAQGVVDVLAEDGHGVDAVHGIVGKLSRKARTHRAMVEARNIVSPISLDELIRVADVWVDAALALEPADVRKMRHLAKAQARRSAMLDCSAERGGSSR